MPEGEGVVGDEVVGVVWADGVVGDGVVVVPEVSEAEGVGALAT